MSLRTRAWRARTRLERIINEFNLYSQARKTGDMENIVERMRRDINVETVKGDPYAIAAGTDVIDGRRPLKRYGGEKISAVA